jgi:alpha-beta hydrolase superfamily lysophospholipase
MPRHLLTLTAVLALAALGGCSAAGVLNAAVSHKHFRAESGLAYGNAPRQKLDVYVPTTDAPPAASHGRPVVVFFHGGSWQTGSRSSYLFVGAALASRGFVAVLPDYRTWPDTAFPGFVDDAATAVRWARDHAAEFGGDSSRIFLMGHSAGAHIVMLLATDGRYLAAQQMNKNDIGGVIGTTPRSRKSSRRRCAPRVSRSTLSLATSRRSSSRQASAIPPSIRATPIG